MGEEDGSAKTGYLSRKYSLGIKDLNWCLLQKFGAEFFGTMFLIIYCVGSANTLALKELGKTEPAYYISISIAFGLGIGGIVYLLAPTSGGHVNPAVSLALLLDKRMSLLAFVVYLVAQFAGGFAGAGILYGLSNVKDLPAETEAAGVNFYKTDEINTAQAFFLEVFGTLFLVLTVLAAVDEARGHAPSYLQPLAIGFSILVMHIFLIPFTNCAINPVRGTVWNIVTGQANRHTLVFLFAPFVASIVGVPLYNVFLI